MNTMLFVHVNCTIKVYRTSFYYSIKSFIWCLCRIVYYWLSLSLCDRITSTTLSSTVSDQVCFKTVLHIQTKLFLDMEQNPCNIERIYKHFKWISLHSRPIIGKLVSNYPPLSRRTTATIVLALRSFEHRRRKSCIELGACYLVEISLVPAYLLKALHRLAAVIFPSAFLVSVPSDWQICIGNLPWAALP